MASRRALVTFLCLAGSLPAQRGLNLLFYGNSYSIDNWTVPALVEAIAREAGHVAPRVVARLFGGTDLRFHRTDPAQVAAIHTSLPPGESWDFVVMQGLSLEPTHKGDPVAFRAHALGILHNVRAHSPAARAVLFQTWARGPGHGLYPGGFPHPWAMHTEVAQSYQLARADIVAACGPDSARLARVGDAVALLGFAPRHYHPDLSHPGHDMTVLAAMTIYTAIYRRPARSLSPSFAGATPLAVHFATYGFPPESWFAMRGYADLVADRTLRPFPGSSDDLLVRTGDGTLDPPCPRLTIENGATLHALLVSPVGGYARTSALLFVDVMRPTPFPGFPELHVSPATAVTLGASAALGSGLQVVLPVTWTMLSSSLVVQGAALAPSRTTGNPLFTTSDAHEVVIR